jgi:hypothetical protein
VPTLINSFNITSAGIDTSNLSTGAFAVNNGDIIIVGLITWDASNPSGAVSDGSSTYTTRVTGPTSGFNCYVRVDTAKISGSPGTINVTSGGTATNSHHSMAVRHLRNADLAATPAVNATTSGSGAPSANITTVGNNSAVVWVEGDEASLDPATAAFRLGATGTVVFDGHVGSNSVHYAAHVLNVGAAGTYAMGMTAPTPQTWALAGIEVLDVSSSNATVNATSVAGVATIPTPTVQTGETVTGVAVAGVATIPTPAVHVGVTVFPAAVAGVAGIPTPLINPVFGGTGPVFTVGAPLTRWTVGSPLTRWEVGP